MPRCCTQIEGEFAPCYASVLVASDLKNAVRSLEQAPLQASVTAWCPVCKGPYLLTGALDMFPTPAAHHAHMIILSQRMLSRT
jgi:hypothetical protein